MPITHQIDEAGRRLTVTVSGDVRGAAFAEHLCRLYDARPELFDHDCLIDLSSYCGDIGPGDINRVAALYATINPRSQLGRRTIFVTPDVHFAAWASIMDMQFPGRTHAVARSLERARAALDGPERRDAAAA